MSQVIAGTPLGNGVYDLVGAGNPNTRTDRQDLFAARVGSTYRRTDGASGSAFYVCTTAGTPATGSTPGVAGVWTAIG